MASKGGAAEEAAGFVAAATQRLEDDENHAEAADLATKALALYRQLGDGRGAADALRIVVGALALKSQVTYDKFEKVSDPQAYEEALRRARDELAAFTAAGDRYGEASMRCSLAELAVDRRPTDAAELAEAADHAERAKGLFRDLAEQRAEARACLAANAASLARRSWPGREVGAAAREAARLSQAAGDRRGEARALHWLAVSLARAPATSTTAESVEEGLGHAQRALQLWREAGAKRAEAQELHHVAGVLLAHGRPREALPYAKQALDAVEALDYGKGWQAECRSKVVEALSQVYDWREARRLAWEGVVASRSSGNKRNLVLLLDSLIHVHLDAAAQRKGSMAEAMAAAEEAVAACREFGDRKWEANQVFNMAQIHFRQQRWQDAEACAQEAAKLDEDIGEEVDRAVKLELLVDIHCECSRHDKALMVAQEIREAFRKRGERQREAQSCLNVAQCHMMLEDVEKALSVAAEAQAMFQQEGDHRGEADAWELVVRLQQIYGRPPEAAAALKTAIGLQQCAGDKRAQAYSLQRAAAMAVEEGRHEEAVAAAFEALALARACADTLAEVEMLMLVSQANLGQLAKVVEQAGGDEARVTTLVRKGEAKVLRPARECLAIALQHGDDYFTGGAHYALAQAYLFVGFTESGVTAGREAQRFWGAAANPGGAAYAALLVAEGLWLSGDSRAAEAEATAALETLRDAGDRAGEGRAQELLAKFRAGGPGPARGTARAPAAALADVEASAAEELPVIKGIDVEDARKIAREVAVQAIGSEDEIDLDSPLMDVGLDSLSSIAFREQLIATSGITVPTSLVFDYPSLVAIADHLVELSLEPKR